MNQSAIDYNHYRHSDSRSFICRDLHSIANYSAICDFTKNEPTCHQGGYANILAFVYCNFSQRLVPLSLLPLGICLIILFICVGICADEFFCPSLHYISELLRLSENVAGVTLLALGNGAPDIISASLAVFSSKQKSSSRDPSAMLGESTGLAFGALLGAAIFICTGVVGLVSVTNPFKSIERPLLRDITFLLLASFLISTIIYRQQIRLQDAIALLVVYGSYVLFVISTKIVKALVNGIRSWRRADLWPRSRSNTSTLNEAQYLLIDESSSVGEPDERIGTAEPADDIHSEDMDNWRSPDDLDALSASLTSSDQSAPYTHQNFETCIHRIKQWLSERCYLLFRARKSLQ
ncbi:hypothetical protein ACOME3_008008 [Neoechinorhynchus agilis]